MATKMVETTSLVEELIDHAYRFLHVCDATVSTPRSRQMRDVSQPLSIFEKKQREGRMVTRAEQEAQRRVP